MNRILAGVMVIALVTAWLAFGQGTPQKAAPAKNAGVEKELNTLADGWSDAYVKADVALLDRMLADDWVATGSDGSSSTKAQEIADLKSGDFKVTSLANDDRKIRVYADAAVVTGRCTLKAQYKGTDASGEYRFTDTSVSLSGRWQCVATHLSKIAEQK